jgi:hypothetical protein
MKSHIISCDSKKFVQKTKSLWSSILFQKPDVKVHMEKIDQWEGRKFGTEILMVLSEQSFKLISISKKQAEVFHLNFSLTRHAKKFKKSFAHVQKILISFYWTLKVKKMNVVIQSPKLKIKRGSCYKNKLFFSNNSWAHAHQVIGIRRGKTYFILLFIRLFFYFSF